MRQDIDRVLIDAAAIDRRLEELAADITRDLTPGSSAEITIVPILTGSFIFVADLIRKLPLRMNIQLTSVSSYPGKATTSQGVRARRELSILPPSLAGAHVLLVDDILDSGGTLRFVTDMLREKNPASLRTCVLLRKQRPEAMATPVDYAAFDIPDEFVVGYGLDFDGYYRNLPDICTLRPEVIRGEVSRAR